MEDNLRILCAEIYILIFSMLSLADMIDYLLSGSNNPAKGQIEFDSYDHVRFENGKAVSGHNFGANRRVVIESNIEGGLGYTVTLYNMDGLHPVWRNNIQMAPKPMRIVKVEGQVVTLCGWGYDNFGGDYSDYGILLLIVNKVITRVQLNMYDRGVSIVYFPPFSQVRPDSFSFEPSRYDEWRGGKKIDSGLTKIKVDCTFFDEGNSVVRLLYNDLQNKLSDCSFDMAVTLEDRVLLFSNPSQSNADILAVTAFKYTFPPSRIEKNYLPTEPVVSSLFFRGGRLVKMTFTMSNPERLIELY